MKKTSPQTQCLSQEELQHLYIDRGLGRFPMATLSDILRERHGLEISPNYLGMILRRERTGYRYRTKIAAALGKQEHELWEPRRPRKPRRPVAGQIPSEIVNV